MNEQNAYPGVKQAIIMVLKVLGLQIFFGLVLEVLSNTLGLNIGLHPSSIAVVNSAAFGIVFLLVKKKINVPWREIFPLKPISLPLLVAILLAVPGEAILCSELDSLTRYLLPVPKFFEEFIVDFAKACANSLWGGILLLILVAPLTEELMFRGIVEKEWRFPGDLSLNDIPADRMIVLVTNLGEARRIIDDFAFRVTLADLEHVMSCDSSKQDA